MEDLKGRRFKMVELWRLDEEVGIKIGDEGVIIQHNSKPHALVRMDKYNDKLHEAFGLCEEGHGAAMRLDQIELLPEEEWTPKFGEKVLVWDNDGERKEECIFVSKREDSDYPYNVVAFRETHKFESKNKAYTVVLYKHISPLPETITKAEAEERFNVKIKG